ncbi:aldolase [Methylobacterium sp. DB1607]|jgi:citrate lyase beta subunit|nr:aldolase [Methylobacterium sp. DB1607]
MSAPAAPRRARTVGASAGGEPPAAAGAETLLFETAPVGPLADLRARRPGQAIYAVLDGVDDPRLDNLMSERPDGVLLREARSGRDVAALGGRLAVCEALAGLPDGATVIFAEIGHPLGVLDARSFIGASRRLAGLGLDGSAPTAGLPDADALAQARGLIRLAAAAAGVSVFERLTAGADRPPEGLAAAAQDGFGWVVLRRPARVADRERVGAG